MVEREIEGRRQPIVTVIRTADRLTFFELHRAIRAAQADPVELAWTAWNTFSWVPLWLFRLLWPLVWWMIRRNPELQRIYRGTVGVTAVGMFTHGGGWGIPVTNNTEITIGGTVIRPTFVGDTVVPREMVALTLSFDHTLIDGAEAVRFTERFRQLIESAHGLPATAEPAAPAVSRLAVPSP
jgi:pyruvate/2-oxoglutarate dehydrogenase complex dihydrolipoamide acyltransferase (E2) component